jgi:replicative DNA helicase
MAKISRESFGYLGADFQLRLVAQLLVDNKFAESIIDIIDANYFDDQHLRVIVSTIKDAYQEYNIIPDMGSLEFRLLDQISNEFDQKYALAQLRMVKDANLNDSFAVQDKAMKFCKQQELKKSIKEIQLIIDKGDISRYDECEEILKRALEHGDNKDDGINVLDNIDAVLADDFRKPIPTGIKGLDEIMDGGLSKGELAIILAPFGVGKTTMMTKIANTAKNIGHNVLQIVFEDDKKIIQRKHLACWSGYDLNSLSKHKDELKELVERKKKEPGILRIKKFPSDGTTIPIIRQYIRKLIAQGVRPDIVLLDYIDCVQPSKRFDDVNAGEGNIMRQFETLLSEFNIAGWTAVQGNRSSIKSEVVEADQMGGSIKRGQIGHFVVSIAKTLDQKENGTATMAILKSRFGKDGMILPDIIFDNARIQIDMNGDKVARTKGEYNKEKEKEEKQHVRDMLSAIQKRKAILNNNVEGGAVQDNDLTEDN